MFKIGFDNGRYVELQSEKIRERVDQFGGKLYLEFGGKLFDDYHASRVLPGFEPDSKIRMLKALADDAEIVIAINADAIEKNKRRGDIGITYDQEVLRLIDAFTEFGLYVGSVVITQFAGQPLAEKFESRLRGLGVKSYRHYPIEGYPSNIPYIVSEDGYGKNDYIETTRSLVVVTAPGPGSGKMATCLSQLYHENKRGTKAGYAKFETFPIWNLPLKHPVNIAYEAATAELRDFNMIDPFHLETYQKTTVNYNRDVEVFPVIRKIMERIMDRQQVYKSPTDMGVNCAGAGIIDDAAVQAAACQEIVRRYFRYSCEYAVGLAEKDAVQRVQILMDDLGLVPGDRPVVGAARAAAAASEAEGKGNAGVHCGAALELPDGRLVSGKNSPLLHASASMLLNACKLLADIPDKIHLLSPAIIESISCLKKNILAKRTPSLDVEETLIALSISATANPAAGLAMEKLKELRGCEVHLSHMPTPGDEAGLRPLGVNLTSDPCFAGAALFND